MKAMIGYNNKLLPYYLPHPSVEEVDGKQVLAIWVPAGDSRPYEVRCDVTNPRSESKCYIRSGSSTIEAKGDPLNELREMANRVPFDDRGNKDISIKDISMILVQDYLRRVQSRLADICTDTRLSPKPLSNLTYGLDLRKTDDSRMWRQ